MAVRCVHSRLVQVAYAMSAGAASAPAAMLAPMKSKSVLELADVKAIAQAAEAEALKNSWAVSIAIVDDGGHLLLLHRLDGAAPISAQIAPAKAQTAALGR